MRHRSLCRLLMLAALTLLSTALALAQTSSFAPQEWDTPRTQTWDAAQRLAASKHTLVLVTTADPTHRHFCSVRSFTASELVCKTVAHRSHSYRSQDITVLILPGGSDSRWPLFLGTNFLAAVAFKGAVDLAPACIPCSVITAALGGFLSLAGLFALSVGDSAETLLYLAPGQTLQIKLRN